MTGPNESPDIFSKNTLIFKKHIINNYDHATICWTDIIIAAEIKWVCKPIFTAWVWLTFPFNLLY